jgi:hypothetical protein
VDEGTEDVFIWAEMRRVLRTAARMASFARPGAPIRLASPRHGAEPRGVGRPPWSGTAHISPPSVSA